MRRLLLGIAAALLVGNASPALALPKVLICFADPNANLGAQIAAGINPGGMPFAAVDTLDCQRNTPTLATLKMYDGVFVFDDAQYLDRIGLGNNLADYVDAGGGVVQAMYNLYSQVQWQLGGRWATGNYNCINFGNPGQGNLKAQANDPNSPLVTDVKALTTANASQAGLVMGATSVWDYDTNFPAIASCKPNGHLRVDLNFYPNPNSFKGDGYNAIRNALVVVAGGLSPVKASPSPAKFPDTGTGATSAPLTITFTNASMAAQTATSLAVTGANAAEFGIVKQPQWPVTVQPAGTFTVDVNFSPGTMGARTAKLSVALSGMNVPPAEVTLNGTGIGAKVVVDPNPINVGGTQIGNPISKTVSITNSGGGKITISGMTLSNPAFTITGAPDLPVIVGSGGSFSFTVNFKPTQNGITKDVLVLTTSDVASPTLSVPVSGYAGPPALDCVTSVIFGAVNVGARSPQQIVDVKNVGFSDLTITDIQPAGAMKGDFVLDKMMLPGVIGAQQSAPVGVTFAPTAAGDRTAQVVITSNDVNKPTLTVNLYGTGTNATLMVAPKMLDFGTIRVGTTSPGSDVTITSVGDGALQVQDIKFIGKDAAAFVQSGGQMPPFAVAANTSSKVSFACKPGTIGTLTANANIVTDVGSAMVALTCVGTSPKIAVTPNLIDFGPVPVNATSQKQTVSIANLGTDDLNIISLDIVGADQADFSSDDMPMLLPATIKPGQSLSFTVAFSPTSAAQENAEIDFSTDDPLLPNGHIDMTGLGAQAGLSASTKEIDFGTVLSGLSSAPQPVTFINSGEITLHITAAVVSGPNASVFHVDRPFNRDDPFPLPPKQSVMLNLTFTPIGQGPVMGTLQVSTKENLPLPAAVALKGNGFYPNVKIGLPGGGSVVDFGNVIVGVASDPVELALLNAGTGSITLGTISAENAAFKIDTSMTQVNLGPQGRTSVVVRFVPTTVGAAKANFSVKLKDGVSAVAVLGLQGNGVPPVNAPSGGCSVGARRTVAGSVPGLVLLLAVCGLIMARRRSTGRAKENI